MKTVTAKQTFKKVSAKQVELFPVLADRLGKQRPAVEFMLPEYEATDLPDLVANHGPVLLTCLNEALSLFAKGLFAAKPSEWDFSPTLDDLSLEALAASFESVTRGRMLTLENATKLATWIQKNLAAIVTGIQVSEPAFQATQASAIIGVIAKYTMYEGKGAEFADKVIMRLNQIMEAVADSEELLSSFMEEPVLAGIMEALVKKFSKSIEEEITVDAL
jgi:hypothetical protein